MVVPALISAGASLLGGVLGRKKEKSAEQNSYDAIMGQARGSREASGKYGFNPLTLLGASSAVGPSQSANYLGSAIADAGLLLADGLAKRQDKIGQVAALTQENEKLRQQAQQATLRPKVGGVYAQRQATPTMAQALGGRSGRSIHSVREGVPVRSSGAIPSGDDGSSLRPLATQLPVDPRREVENKPIEPHSGFMVVDNPYFPGRLYFPTLDGDEAMSVFQLPLIPWSWAGSMVAERVKGRIEEYRGKKSRPKPKPSKSDWPRGRGTGPHPDNPVYPMLAKPDWQVLR